MARFMKAQADCIKAKMLQRMDTMYLTDEDVYEVIKDTGLHETQIRWWADHFRNRYRSKAKEEIEAFLRNEEKVRDRLPILGVELFSTPSTF